MARLGSVCVALFALTACSGDDAGSTVTLTDSEVQRLAAIQTGLRQAESIRAIKRLQRAYGQYISAGRWTELAELFASGARVDMPRSSFTGTAGLSRFLEREYGADFASSGLPDGRLNEHLLLSPVINLDSSGTSARGRWRLVALLGEFGASAGFAGGIFENDYVLEDGVWKIAALEFYPLYAGPYASGWRNLKEEAEGEVEPVPFHYDATTAGIPAPPVSAEALAARDAIPDVAALERLSERLLSEQAVLNLQNAYGYYVDRMLWDDAADLFAADATYESGSSGVYRGRDSIRALLSALGPSPLPAERINDRLQLQPVVSLADDGMSATVRGTELLMLGTFAESAQWGINVFDNTFVNTDSGWQIGQMQIHSRMLADYETGWANEVLAGETMPDELPAADAPSTMAFASYPVFSNPDFDFTPRSIGTPVDLSASAASQPTAAQLDELERRVRVLNAYDGAENVSNAYGYYIDEFLWDGMADVFAVDGWKELSYIGTYVGRERVRGSVVDRYGRGGRRPNGMTFHQKVQPVVTVAEDGRSANIRTRLFQLNSSRASAGSYISGIYENQIVIEDGVWKILGMDLDYQWTANYDPGWHQVEPGSSQRFAPAPGSLQGEAGPDRPLRGVTFAPYPEGQVDMGFHYANPVSGRAPPLLLDDSVYAE